MEPPPPRPRSAPAAAPSKQADASACTVPTRRVLNQSHLGQWQASCARADLLGFVRTLSEAVRGVSLSAPVHVSPAVSAAVAVLDDLEAWVDTFPPVQQAMRYGNTAFRSWHARLVSEANELTRRVLPVELQAAAVELGPYLCDAFGNATRIDYGTGHEAAFAQWLCALCLLGVFTAEDSAALVTRVFARYVAVMRRLQTSYWLEPAGSHGVWGLDDYAFLPFLWGAAQLEGQQELRPSCIHDDTVLAGAKGEWLYLGAVAFVRGVKRGGPLRETSPMLSDISALPTWRRVTQGMLRMFEAEVLDKFPIAQHFLFGTLLSCAPENPLRDATRHDVAQRTPHALT